MANWKKIGSRGNVQDRRGMAAGISTVGVTGIILLMGVTYLMGGNPLQVLQEADVSQLTTEVDTEQPVEFAGEDSYEEFVSIVLGSNNDAWRAQLATQGTQYVEPTLVLFRGRTNSACGGAASMMGPHYCPLDSTIYLDETFFDELQNRLGAAGGDVAEAYVIAHEVGHHVQNLLGDLEARRTNAESIDTELQADCYAGLWAYTLRDSGVFAPGEIAEAMDAAAAVGDDNIQKTTQGEVHPESWTHGSSEARVAAFTAGYESGQLSACR